MTEAPGVAGNARLTAAAGAVIFVLLAAEGVTILRVHALLAPHIFIGMVLVPIALVKSSRTIYRIARYYTNDEPYVRKGPPQIVLRVLGPFVVVLTFAVLATGIAAAIAGPRSHTLLEAHKASFILWFGVMTVHVLAHLLDTARLARSDWVASSRHAVPGARLRSVAIVGALVIGIGLGAATYHWSNNWPRHEAAKRFSGSP